MGDLMSKLQVALNKELLKRMLTQYFTQKGYNENFDRKIYPPTIQDMGQFIPQLTNKLEVIPHIVDIEPQTGIVKLGWNLFILGNKRMYLGESTHTNLSEIRVGQMTNGQTIKTNYPTPKRIIEFILKTLENSKNGDVSDIPLTIGRQPLALGTGEQSGYYRYSQRQIF